MPDGNRDAVPGTAYLSHAQNMPSEVIEYGLPTIALLFDRVCRLCIESFADNDVAVAGIKLNQQCPIAERALDQLMLDNLCIRASEIEAHTAILGFHPRGEYAAFPQIYGRLGCMPIIGSGIPLLDVLGRSPCLPDIFDRCSDSGFDGDLHMVSFRGCDEPLN